MTPTPPPPALPPARPPKCPTCGGLPSERYAPAVGDGCSDRCDGPMHDLADRLVAESQVSPSPAPALATDAPLDEKWEAALSKLPPWKCGRIDMHTYLIEPVTVGRVTSDIVRYIYFEDGQEVIVLGQRADEVAYAASKYRALKSASGQAARPAGWQYVHEAQNALLARDGWMCEAHPGLEWPHGDCAGPGMVWQVEGKDAVRALAASGQAARALRPLEEWREEDGPVLWFHLPLCEPPWVGTPLDSDWLVHEEGDAPPRDIPWRTHWCPLPEIMPPALSSPPPRTTEKTQ